MSRIPLGCSSRLARARRRSALGRRRDRRRRAQAQRGVSGKISIIGEVDRRRAEVVRGSARAVQEGEPGRQGQRTRARATTLPQVVSTAVRAATRRTSRRCRSRARWRTSRSRGALKPITFAKPKIAKRTTARLAQARHGEREAVRPLLQGGQQVDRLVQRQVVQERGRQGRRRRGRSSSTAAKTLRASGTPAYSIGGADGWTLTDLFENIYLRTAGAAKYDLLSTHKIKWTDPSVKTALQDDGAGRRRHGEHRRRHVRRAADGLPTRSATSSATRRRRRWCSRATSSRASSRANPGSRRSAATTCSTSRRSTAPSRPSVGGGDIVDDVQGHAGIARADHYLATPAAATIWAKRGGFSSPNKDVKPSFVPGSASAEVRAGAREGGGVLRHVGPAAGVVRRNRRPG